MKGFSRTHPIFSLCGLPCGLCTMHLGGYCPGCGGGEGNQSCAIARCSLDHGGVQFCWECGEYPCSRYEGEDEYDSFVSHRYRGKDVERARQMGIDAFLEELREKQALLEKLLAGYNDGRRKTLFSTAACRLETEDLRQVLDELAGLGDLPLKEQAGAAAKMLEIRARERGLDLKLRKKPKADA